MDSLLSQLINGIAYAMLLFVMSAGLSLIFGLMNVVNLSHGSFFMLGAYFAMTLLAWSGNFWLAVFLAPLPAIALGVIIERVFLRSLYARGHLDQVLLTFGFTFVFADAVRWMWGSSIRDLPVPQLLDGTVQFAGLIVPQYRLFIIALGFATALVLAVFLERSRIGAMVRASVDDAFTAAGLGINVQLLFASMFAVGVGLAALGGAFAAPILGVHAGLDIEILIPAFIVVVVGGMGSLRGAFVASLLVGVVDTLGKTYFPAFALFLIYLLMIAVLLIRPHGLFGIARS